MITRVAARLLCYGNYRKRRTACQWPLLYACLPQVHHNSPMIRAVYPIAAQTALLLVIKQLSQHSCMDTATANDQAQALPTALPAGNQQGIQFLQRKFNGFVLVGNVTGQAAAIVLAKHIGVTFGAHRCGRQIMHLQTRYRDRHATVEAMTHD